MEKKNTEPEWIRVNRSVQEHSALLFEALNNSKKVESYNLNVIPEIGVIIMKVRSEHKGPHITYKYLCKTDLIPDMPISFGNKAKRNQFIVKLYKLGIKNYFISILLNTSQALIGKIIKDTVHEVSQASEQSSETPKYYANQKKSK